MTIGSTVTIKAGYGYWDTTNHPIGGNFKRAGIIGLDVTIEREFDNSTQANADGLTEDGRRVAFKMEHTTEIEQIPECNKCGGEATNQLVGDELHPWCPDCGFGILHK